MLFLSHEEKHLGIETSHEQSGNARVRTFA